MKSKAEVELQEYHENKGSFALKSCQSRSPVDVAVFGKNVLFFQIKETTRSKIYVGDEVKKLDQLSQRTGIVSSIVVKFRETRDVYNEAYAVLEDIDNKGVKTEADLQNLLLKR
jgi:Holliday junction resolvase